MSEIRLRAVGTGWKDTLGVDTRNAAVAYWHHSTSVIML